MRVLFALLFVILLSGCFERGDIEVRPDRINVTIENDSQSIMAMVTEAFLRAERAMDGYYIEGFGRRVFFNTNGIVPQQCTPELNCWTYTPASETPLETSLHRFARRPITVNIASTTPDADLSGHSEIRWIRSDLERLGFDVTLTFFGVTPSSGLYVNITSYDHNGNAIAGYSEISLYRTTDTPESVYLTHNDNRQLCEAWQDDEEYYYSPPEPDVIGQFRADTLAKIVHFHIDGERAACPTVDPIDWAVNGDCY